MSKHTPGPWRYSPWKSNKTLKNPIESLCPNKALYYPFVADVLSVDIENDEAEANARLIAAAPELLECLVMLYRYSMISPIENVLYSEGSHKEWIAKALKAIVKAEGK